MTTRELLKQDLRGLPQRNAQTVNKVLNLLSGILARAAKDGYFDDVPSWTNPFRVTFEISSTDREPYEPFTAEELRRLFESPVFSAGERPLGGRGEAAYWLPLIALYSGARRTEIAQLKARDVRQSAEGIWFFDFTASDADQSVKNIASARVTPVHPELIRLGLLAYAANRTELGPSAPMWPGFEPPVEPKAKAWSKWFGRYLGQHVTDSPAKTFHSFRWGTGRSLGRPTSSLPTTTIGLDEKPLACMSRRVGYSHPNGPAGKSVARRHVEYRKRSREQH